MKRTTNRKSQQGITARIPRQACARIENCVVHKRRLPGVLKWMGHGPPPVSPGDHLMDTSPLTTPKPRRRWPHCTRRRLLILVLTVDLPLAWFAYKLNEASQQRAAVVAIEEAGGKVYYDHDLRSSAGRRVAEWIGRWAGRDLLSNVQGIKLANAQFADADFACLRRLSQLTFLNLHNTQISDAGLIHCQGMTQIRDLDLEGSQVRGSGLVHFQELTLLRWLSLANTPFSDAGFPQLCERKQLTILNLDGTGVTDAGLEHLCELPRLEILFLENTAITDSGMKHLGGLPQLWELDLGNTQVTDAALEHLKEFPQLQRLHVERTQVSDAGVNELQKALPNLQVTR